jgi:hypothetical protein
MTPHTTSHVRLDTFTFFSPKKGGPFHIIPLNFIYLFFFQMFFFNNFKGILGRKTQESNFTQGGSMGGPMLLFKL